MVKWKQKSLQVLKSRPDGMAAGTEKKVGQWVTVWS